MESYNLGSGKTWENRIIFHPMPRQRLPWGKARISCFLFEKSTVLSQGLCTHKSPLNNSRRCGCCPFAGVGGKKENLSFPFWNCLSLCRPPIPSHRTIIKIGITPLGLSLCHSLKCHAKSYTGAFVAWQALARCHKAGGPQFMQNLHTTCSFKYCVQSLTFYHHSPTTNNDSRSIFLSELSPSYQLSLKGN